MKIERHDMRVTGTLPRCILYAALINALALFGSFAEAANGGKLLFLGNRNIAPVVYLDNGAPAGVAVDIVHALAKHLPKPVEIKAMDWPEAQARVARGEADALIQINQTEERKKIYDFSDTLLESQFSIFTRADKMGVSGLSSLRGLRVGVEAGGLPRQSLEKIPLIQLSIIPDFLTGFKLLNDGAIDAVVVDYRVGSYVIAEHKLRNIKVSGEPIAFSYSAFAVKKGNTELLNEINAALRAIKADGTYQKIIDTWKPTEVVFQTRAQISERAYFLTITVFFVLFVIAGIWTLTLKRELAKRKAAEEALHLQTVELEQEVAERQMAQESLEEQTLQLEEEAENRQMAQEALHRLNRELRAVSDCNQVVVRAEDEQTLLDDVCRIICDEVGYRMVWVGYADNDDARTIRPVAWAGAEEGYLGQAGITWGDTERGQGPVGKAIRNGEIVCVQDFTTDPQMVPWRENALLRGYRSCVALPLKDENATAFGALTVYAGEVNIITADEIRLLEELAGDLTFGIMVLRARTERKLAEDALRRLNEELEQRVWERTGQLEESQKALMNIVEDLNLKTAELENANSILLELDRLKSMFIASMSHELRTPLNSIIGFSSIIRDGWLGTVNPEQKENLDTIQHAGKHLLSLINDVIDVSKIEAGKIDVRLEEFDLYELMTETVQYLEKDIREKGLELTLQIGHQVLRTDKRRLLQCIINLLSNAVKFTEKGEITVSSAMADARPDEGGDGALPGGSGSVIISVCDTGIGIAEGEISAIFKPFVRLESPLKTTVPGTGLGLYLTRKLVVEVLHGDIVCKSDAGKGSTFTLRIPERIDEKGTGSRG
jgi:signal transduction histidine kinase